MALCRSTKVGIDAVVGVGRGVPVKFGVSSAAGVTSGTLVGVPRGVGEVTSTRGLETDGVGVGMAGPRSSAATVRPKDSGRAVAITADSSVRNLLFIGCSLLSRQFASERKAKQQSRCVETAALIREPFSLLPYL